MNKKLKKQIESYLEETMSPTEIEAFEAEMEKDQELRNEIKLYREMDIVFSDDNWLTENSNQPLTAQYINLHRNNEGRRIAKEIDNVQNRYFQSQSNKPKSLNKKHVWIIAASVTALLALSSILVESFKENKDPQLLYMTYRSLNDLPSFAQRDSSTILSDAELQFKEGHFERTIQILSEYQTNSSEINPQVLMYLGMSYLEINETEKALEVFDQLLQSETLDSQKAYWYLGLVYLKISDVNQAIMCFKNSLEINKNYKSEKIHKLLKELD